MTSNVHPLRAEQNVSAADEARRRIARDLVATATAHLNAERRASASPPSEGWG